MVIELGDNWLAFAVMGALLSALAVAVLVLGVMVAWLERLVRRQGRTVNERLRRHGMALNDLAEVAADGPAAGHVDSVPGQVGEVGGPVASGRPTAPGGLVSAGRTYPAAERGPQPGPSGLPGHGDGRLLAPGGRCRTLEGGGG